MIADCGSKQAGWSVAYAEEVDHRGSDPISHPPHYTEGRSIEPIDAIVDWELDFCLGNVVKYVARAGRKNPPVEDLKKALFYLQREIELLEGGERG